LECGGRSHRLHARPNTKTVGILPGKAGAPAPAIQSGSCGCRSPKAPLLSIRRMHDGFREHGPALRRVHGSGKAGVGLTENQQVTGAFLESKRRSRASLADARPLLWKRLPSCSPRRARRGTNSPPMNSTQPTKRLPPRTAYANRPQVVTNPKIPDGKLARPSTGPSSHCR